MCKLKIFDSTNIIYKYSIWGFNSFSEILNGRIAMISIVSLLILEISTKQSIIKLLLNLFKEIK
jgi:hypothetical protein